MSFVRVVVVIGVLACVAGCAGSAGSRPEPDWISGRLAASERLAPIAREAERHRLQLLVSEVVEGRGSDPPRLVRHEFRVDSEYFYPASAIKLFAALGALEWLGERRAAGVPIDRDARMRIHPPFPDEAIEERAPSLRGDGTTTVGHEIRKLCIVSDNRAYDRLFELLGHHAIHERAWAAGFPSVRCLHRLAERRGFIENRRTPRIEFPDVGTGGLVIPARTSDLEIDSGGWSGLLVGRARRAGRALTEAPMDFTRKNSVSLRDLQDAMVTTLRPDIPIGKPGYRLDDAARAFLADALRALPRESEDPVYDPEEYPDDWVKFLLPGLRRVVPAADLDVFDKVGLAYGFTIENAYVVDRGTGRSFFVTGGLYTNANEILNDGIYEYDEVAFPFWADLGETLARALLRPDDDAPAEEGR